MVAFLEGMTGPDRSRAGRGRGMAAKYVPFLQRVEIFDNVADADLEHISDLLKERHYRENQVVFRQGDPGSTLLILMDGRIKVYTAEGGNEKVLAFYAEGQV